MVVTITATTKQVSDIPINIYIEYIIYHPAIQGGNYGEPKNI